jgi:uncharacterized RDD family membrane protein YckC
MLERSIAPAGVDGAVAEPPRGAGPHAAADATALSGPDAAVRGRINAIVLDLVLVGIVSTLLLGSGATNSAEGLAVFVVFQFAYFSLFEAAGGQTLGKRLFHVRVASANGEPLTLRQVAIRNALRVVDTLPAFYASGLISLMRTGRARRQRIGDVVAGTVVVVDPDGKPLRTPRWLLPAATIIATLISLAVVIPALKAGHSATPTARGLEAGERQAPAVQARPAARGAATNAFALAYARAVNLRAADLPGMPIAAPERQLIERTCFGAAGSTPQAELDSATFKGGPALAREGVFLRIFSSVAVMPSSRSANARVDFAGSASGRACYLQGWGGYQAALAHGSSQRLAGGRVAGGVLPVSVPGAHGAYGQRVILRAVDRRSGVPRDRYIDHYEFAYGRAAVRLGAIMTPQPFPQRTERLLLSVLAQRAKAHALGG